MCAGIYDEGEREFCRRNCVLENAGVAVFHLKISEYIHKTSPLIFLSKHIFELPYFIGLNFRANLRKTWKHPS